MTRGGRDGATVRARRRVVRRLLAAVVAYWVVLVPVALREPIGLLVRLGDPSGRVTAGVSDENGLSLTIDGELVWRAAFGFSEALAWFLVPPLLLWLAWLVWSVRQPAAALPAPDGRAALGRGAAGTSPGREARAEPAPADERRTGRP